MKVQAKSNNVLIRPDKRAVNKGLIVLTDAVNKKYCWGTVEELGDSDKFEIEVGQHVAYKNDGVTRFFEGTDEEIHVVPYRVLLFWR
jgi:hypothetical protein